VVAGPGSLGTGLMHEPTALARRRWAASAMLRAAGRRATTSVADLPRRADRDWLTFCNYDSMHRD
jgi:hypothetical protein